MQIIDFRNDIGFDPSGVHASSRLGGRSAEGGTV